MRSCGWVIAAVVKKTGFLLTRFNAYVIPNVKIYIYNTVKVIMY